MDSRGDDQRNKLILTFVLDESEWVPVDVRNCGFEEEAINERRADKVSRSLWRWFVTMRSISLGSRGPALPINDN